MKTSYSSLWPRNFLQLLVNGASRDLPGQSLLRSPALVTSLTYALKNFPPPSRYMHGLGLQANQGETEPVPSGQ